jgi:integrase
METELRNNRKKDITKFLRQYNTPNTQRLYRGALAKFLNFINDIPESRRVDPDGSLGKNAPLDMEFYNRLALEYLNEGRDEGDYADDLRDFIVANGAAPGPSRSAWKAAVVQWLVANRIFLHPQEVRRIPVGGSPRTQDRIPTKQELKAIMDHSDMQTRTLITLLSSSGMRPGEALQLAWSDIDIDRGVIKIRGEITKTDTPRVVFISREAIDILREWQKYHHLYIERKRVPNEYAGVEDPTRIFPLAYSNASQKFRRAIERAGLDKRDGSTGRYVLHLHGLRKFFRTNFVQGGSDGRATDVVEILMGHDGYLNGAYVRLTVEQLEQYYREAESVLWIHREPAINTEELKRVEAENERLRAKVEATTKDIEMLVADYSRLKDNFDRLYQDDGVMIDSIESMVRKVIAEQT